MQVMKFLTMQSSPASCNFISPRSKCSPQHPIDGWMDGWMGGRTDGRTDRQTDRRMDRWMDG